MSSQQAVNKGEKGIHQEIIAFYVPLALSSMIMMSSLNVVNSALSRTASPEIAIAAYSVGASLPNMLASPNFAGMQMLITLGKDKQRFQNGVRFMLKVLLVTLGAIGALAFTRLGRIMFVNVFGAPPHLYPEIQAVAKLCLVLPFIFTLGAVSRSVILVERKTHFVTLSRAIRIVVMLALAVLIPQLGFVQGAAVGAVVWILGMATESISNTVWAFFMYKKWPEQAEKPNLKAPNTPRAAFNFMWPLMLTSLLWGLGKPMLNAGLARTVDPEQAIATYQVAANFAWIFIVLIEDNIRQIAVIFGDTEDKLATIRRFTKWLSLSVALFVAVVALTPLNSLLLGGLIGASPRMVANSVPTILVLAVFPLVVAWQEYYIGLMLLRGNTKILGVSKALNLVVMTATVFLLSISIPALGATVGAIAVCAGMATELMIMSFVNRTNPFRLRSRLQSK